MGTIEAANVGITIPKQLIDDLVRAEVVRAIGKQEAIISEIVRQAIGAKENSYDRETRLEKAFVEMIQEESRAIMAEWIAQNREDIRKAFLAHLNEHKGKQLKAMAESLAAGLCDSIINVNVKFQNKDRDY